VSGGPRETGARLFFSDDPKIRFPWPPTSSTLRRTTIAQQQARRQQMDSHVKDDRIELRRSDDEKKPLIQRLNRIEGQVRGLKAMIEDDRYCLDEVQQISAITAALREVALLVISQHVEQGLQVATDPEHRDLAMGDITQLLRSAMRMAD
jgi:DNA-binding FrmR family transcriptional regulator